MSVKSAPYFWLECDECPVKSTEDSEFSAWVSEASAMDEAEEDGWLIRDGRHLCGQCAVDLRCPDCGEYREDVLSRCPNLECLEPARSL